MIFNDLFKEFWRQRGQTFEWNQVFWCVSIMSFSVSNHFDNVSFWTFFVSQIKEQKKKKSTTKESWNLLVELNFILISASFSSQTHLWHSFYNGDQMLLRESVPTLLKKFPQMSCFVLAGFKSGDYAYLPSCEAMVIQEGLYWVQLKVADNWRHFISHPRSWNVPGFWR